MTPDEMIAVIQAFKDGKKIQSRPYVSAVELYEWELDNNPSWNFEEFEFRVKPELKTGWTNVYPGDCTRAAYLSDAYSTEDQAIADKASRCIATIKIQWEE